MKTTTQKYEHFLELSAILTGHSVFVLRGTGVAKLYYATLNEVVGEEITVEFISAFSTILDVAAEGRETLDVLLRKHILSDPKFGPLARNLIKMWYVGSWYELPEAWRTAYGISEYDITFVISSTAYKEGLLWPTIGAHPLGAKAPGYGSWNAPPDIPKAR